MSVLVHENLEADLPINVVASTVEYCVILSGRGLQANFPFPLVPQQHERPELSPLLVDSVELPLLSLDIIFVVNSLIIV